MTNKDQEAEDLHGAYQYASYDQDPALKMSLSELSESFEEHVGQPKILDACCGSKMFWFDKENPNVLFIDKRRETVYAKDSSSKNGEREIKIEPDLIADFTDMPFPNETFSLVVFDPPHMTSLGKNSWMAKKYGRLEGDWKKMISKGFDECMRVLNVHGTLIFKWNESDVMASEILKLIPYKPLFGHTTGRQSKTIWMAFIKLPLIK